MGGRFLNEEPLGVLKKIKSETTSLIICNMKRQKNDTKTELEYQREVFKEYRRIIKKDGVILLVCSQPMSSRIIYENMDIFRYEWVWNKLHGVNFLNANHQPLKTHENILVFSHSGTAPNKKGTSKYNPQMREGEVYSAKNGTKGRLIEGGDNNSVNEEKTYTNRNPISVLTFGKERSAVAGALPVSLTDYMVETYTDIGDIVVAPFAREGEVAVSCINKNRSWLCIEKDADVYKIGLLRINNMK